jgi:hypothetical protein
MTRQLRDLAVRLFLAIFIGQVPQKFARIGSLERVMHPPEGGPQAVFRLRSSPRATRPEISPLPVTLRIGRTVPLQFSEMSNCDGPKCR